MGLWKQFILGDAKYLASLGLLLSTSFVFATMRIALVVLNDLGRLLELATRDLGFRDHVTVPVEYSAVMNNKNRSMDIPFEFAR